jgi:hypothetical protein
VPQAPAPTCPLAACQAARLARPRMGLTIAGHDGPPPALVSGACKQRVWIPIRDMMCIGRRKAPLSYLSLPALADAGAVLLGLLHASGTNGYCKVRQALLALYALLGSCCARSCKLCPVIWTHPVSKSTVLYIAVRYHQNFIL